MTEAVKEKTDIDTQIKEVIKEQEENNRDVVLEARIKHNGELVWHIPSDIVKASYLLKMLDSCITNMVIARITASQRKEEKKPKIFNPFGRK